MQVLKDLLYGSYSIRAKRKGYDWCLTKENCYELFKSNCILCGSEPSNIKKSKSTGNNSYTYNGIDRIDNSKGYTVTNVQSMCWICNRLKFNMNLKDIEEHIKKIARFKSY